MSTGAKITRTRAPALVHRRPVRGGLVLPSAGQGSPSLVSCHSPHALGRGRRSYIADVAIDAINMQPSAMHQQGPSLQSP